MGGDMMSMMMNMMQTFMGDGGDKSSGGGKGWKDRSFGGGKGSKGDWKPNQGGNYKIDDSGGELGEFIGKLKSFSDKNGYGFIECEDISAVGYGDIFLHKDMKKNWMVGSQVRFTCFLTGEGKPHAKD